MWTSGTNITHKNMHHLIRSGIEKWALEFFIFRISLKTLAEATIFFLKLIKISEIKSSQKISD